MAIDLENKILTKKRFSSQVEYTMLDKRIGAMEAVLHICEENQLDPADVGKLITDQLKAKIEAEARSVNMLPRVGTLPGME